MPERAVIPLSVATAAGFLAGLIGSVLQLHGGAVLALGVASAAVVFAAGGASVVGGDAPEREKRTLGALRGGMAVGLFIFIYLGTLQFLRDGQIGLALLLYALAVAYGLVITRLRWRSPDSEKQEPLPVRRRKEQGTEPRGPAAGGARRRRREPRRTREEQRL